MVTYEIVVGAADWLGRTWGIISKEVPAVENELIYQEVPPAPMPVMGEQVTTIQLLARAQGIRPAG
jgi:hypothetical protein